MTALLLFGAATPAVATADSSSNWWFDGYGLPSIHDAGWTGAGVRVAVIDSNINPDVPAFSGRRLNVDPRPLCADAASATTTDVALSAIHGTTITAEIIGTGEGAGQIRGIAPEADVTFYSLGRSSANEVCPTSEYNGSLGPVSLGLQRAIDAGAQIVTTSVGEALDPTVVANAIAKNVVVIYAGPNQQGEEGEGSNFRVTNGVVVVSPIDRNGDLGKNPDGSPHVVTGTTVVAAGLNVPTIGSEGKSWSDSRAADGSSYAAPLVAGMLALVKQHYPQATGNQLLQTLIRNTGVNDHQLVTDMSSGFGFGVAWPAHMLREDPTQFPDVNPLLDKPGGSPSAAQIARAAESGSTYPWSMSSSAAPTSTTSQSPSAEPALDELSSLLITIVVAILVMIIGGAGVTAIVIARKKRTPPGGTP